MSYLPNVYKSKAVVLLADNNNNGLSSALSSSGLNGIAALAGMNISGPSSGDLAALLVKSPSSIDELNRKYNFTNRYRIKKNIIANTREKFLKYFNVVFDEKTNILTISFTDRDPEYSKNVVNASVEILDRRFSYLNGEKANNQKILLEQKILNVQVQIKEIENKIKEFQSNYGVLSIEALASEQIAILARLRSEQILKDLEIQNYMKFANIEDPVVLRLKSERDNLKNTIIEIENSNSIIPSQNEIPEITFIYAKLQRDYLIQNEIFKILSQQYEIAKFNSEGMESMFQIIEQAEAADKKYSPSRSLICIFACFGSFLFSIFLAITIEYLKNIKSDLERKLRLEGGGE
jgi:uncharacterized protein involved in exopolysaccharide biosynthesis